MVVQKLSSMVFSIVLCDPWSKLALSHIVWEIPNVVMHYLPDKKVKHSHASGCGPDWLAGIVVNHGLDLTDKYGSAFLIRTIRVRLWRCSTFVITIRLVQLFWILYTILRLTFRHSEMYILKLLAWMPSSSAFSKFWRSELHPGAAFLTDSARLTRIYCTVDRTWNKQNACVKLIIYPLHPIYYIWWYNLLSEYWVLKKSALVKRRSIYMYVYTYILLKPLTRFFFNYFLSIFFLVAIREHLSLVQFYLKLKRNLVLMKDT